MVGQKVRPRSKILLSDLDSVLEISITLLLHVIGELDSTFCSGIGIVLLLPVLWELDSTVRLVSGRNDPSAADSDVSAYVCLT